MENKVEEIFMAAGAILEGHFLLTSGKHSGRYLEKFQVLQYPNYTEILCKMIAERFRNDNVEVVAGPTTGGVIIAYEVGRLLGVRSIFAEKGDQGRVFRRGFTIKPGERVLVVDDILTTGGSVFDVLKEVRKHEGNVVGVGVLVDRSGGGVDFGAPLFSCGQINVESYAPGDCPLCLAGVPLVKPGGG